MIYHGHVKAASHSTPGDWDTFTYTVVVRAGWSTGDVEVPNVKPWNRPTPAEIDKLDFWPYPPSTLVEVHELEQEWYFHFPPARPKYTNCDGSETW